MPKNLFKPGASGNPKGRPKGTKNHSVALRKEMELILTKNLSKDIGRILQKAIDMALEGDRVMIKMLVDKMIASPKIDDGTLEKTSGGIHIHVSPMVMPENKEKTVNTIEGEVNG